MYIPELDYSCDLLTAPCECGYTDFDVSILSFVDTGKELQQRLEKRENFPAHLFNSNFDVHVWDFLERLTKYHVEVGFALPQSAYESEIAWECGHIDLTAELSEAEKEYIKRLIFKDLGIEEEA